MKSTLNLRAKQVAAAAALFAIPGWSNSVFAQSDQMPAGYDDPGPKPENVLPPIVAKLRVSLRDPTSVRDLVVCEPKVAKTFKYPGAGNVWERAHWVVYFSLNARNGFGGYSGRRAFTATFDGGALTDVASPDLGPDLNAKMVGLTEGCPQIPESETQRLFS